MRRLPLPLILSTLSACLIDPEVRLPDSPFEDPAGTDCGDVDVCSVDGSAGLDADAQRCILDAADACDEAYARWQEISIEGDPITLTVQVRADCSVELTVDSTQDSFAGAPYAWFTCAALSASDACPGLAAEECVEREP